jgi:hypothetical protein
VFQALVNLGEFSMSDTKQTSVNVDQAGVSLLAYQMWKDAGCPEGQDQKFWFEAEVRMRAAAKASSPPPKPAAPPVLAAPTPAVIKPAPAVPLNPAFDESKVLKPKRKSRRS